VPYHIPANRSSLLQVCFGNRKFLGLSIIQNYSNRNQGALIISTGNKQNGASVKIV